MALPAPLRHATARKRVSPSPSSPLQLCNWVGNNL